MESKHHVRLADIALELGLTANTVSRALRDKSDIGAETKALVKETAERLGYIPNSIAASLRYGSTSTIAIVFDNLKNPYFMIMADKIHQRLQPRGYASMIFAGDNGKLETAVLPPIVSRKVDGIVTFLEPSKAVLDILADNAVPIVLVGRRNADLKLDSVATDDAKGGYEIGKLLLERGAKNIGYIGAPEEVECSRRRFDGLRKCLADHRQAIHSENIRFMTTPTLKDDLDVLVANGVDAIFCFNDMMALECHALLRERGIRVPEQIRIAGFDDLQKDIFLPVRLTTVTSDKDAIIDAAVGMLMRRIESHDPASHPRFVDFDVAIVRGETT